MDILPIIFFIMFLLIVGIIIYIIYDYMNYKDNVDDSMEKTTTHMNTSFDKVSKNIDTSEKNLLTEIEKTNNNVNNTNDNLNKLQNTVDLNKQMLSSKIDDVNNDMTNFDASLKKYFEFRDNNNVAISNEKIFKHVFSSITPDIRLLTNVDVVSGMTIRTSDSLKNEKNLKICNTTDSCIQLNVNDKGFNITPDKANDLIINNINNKPMARFDMKNDSIYFGGENIDTSPMFIQNSNLYLNNVNMIVKQPGTKYNTNNLNDIKDLSVIKITGEDMYTLGQDINTILDTGIKNVSKYYKNTVDFLDKNKPLFTNAMNTTKDSFYKMADASKQIIVNYSVVNRLEIVDKSTSSTANTNEPNIEDLESSVINDLYLKIIPNSELKTGDIIQFEIPYYEIGNIITIDPSNNNKTYIIQNMNINNQLISTQLSTIEAQISSALFKIVLASDTKKNVPVYVSISGKMLSYKELKDKNGMTIGTIIPKIPEINYVDQSYDKISKFFENSEWNKNT